VPAGVAGIVRMWETYRKAPEAIALYPAPLSHKPIESVMEYRRVRCLLKGSPSIARQPDDGFRPCCRIMGIEGNVPPHDFAAFLGQLPRKGAVDTDEPIPNELRYLRVTERAGAQTIIVTHELSLYRQTVHRQFRAETAGLLRSFAKNSSAGVVPGLLASSIVPVLNSLS